MTERVSRGSISVIRNPAIAVAMAKCWLADWKATIPAANFHPDTCAYCDTPRDLLMKQLEEFRDWAGISVIELEESPLRMEIEQWETMPVAEQTRLIQKAFALPVEEEPVNPRSPW